MLALTAYPVLAGRRDSRELGGAQVQQVMIARALVRAGIQVTFICMDYGQPEEEWIDGIRVIRTYGPNDGVRGLRFFHPRVTGLFKAMRRANADVYYQRCSGMTTGLMTAWCRWHHKPAIYAGASDLDFQPGPPNVHNRRDRWLFNRGLRQAAAVVLQNPRQRELLQANHGRDGTLIPSCYATPDHAGQTAPAGSAREVLWIGMIRKVKRPDRFLALARALPHVQFRMIGGAMGDAPEVLAYYDAIAREAATLPNLHFMGFVPFAEADSYFDRAALLVNTSDHEGFPNTFLQAWSRKVPSAALFDTGSRVDGKPPYALADSDAALEQWVARLMSEPAAHAELAELGHSYFQREHAPAATAQRYLELLSRLVDAR
ncbi:glycosyltransferase [Duganella sp. CY15W]|uniref:glycosyltransferase family 4 protein n=1 Tax=Duganella sp. CY15W TaxID=2692172 RepID=UPI00136DDC70|nr:glycosyltransferase family 4 protein [Duganella sp. CY15W]MYM32539.1 glycosyltransferase [Duganella sp. CY15W]